MWVDERDEWDEERVGGGVDGTNVKGNYEVSVTFIS